MPRLIILLRCLGILAAGALLQANSRAAQEFAGENLTLTDFLVLPRVGRYGRVPIHVDPVQASLANGSWDPPQPGNDVQAEDGKLVKWEAQTVNKEGWLESDALLGGYAYAEVQSAQRKIVLLEATGHAMVFVNGEPRAGDPYLTGRTVLPILLKAGTNEFLFHAAAGKLHVQLTQPTRDLQFDDRDVTLPTLVRGETEPIWVAALLVNSHDRALLNRQITSNVDRGEKLTAKVASVPPLGVRKVAIPIMPPRWEDVSEEVTEVTATISLDQDGEPVTQELKLAIVDPGEAQTRTFRSEIDGSVQDYCLLPAMDSTSQSAPGLLVSLHDTGETASGHLATFKAQEGVILLAPSGRRAEGCDWEDWSARNVLEALDDAAKRVKFDRSRVWLRGTGAGGHGVLRLGGISADRWAALVPRDPWLDYPSESESEEATPIEEMLDRVAWSNRLTPLLRNTAVSGLLLEDASKSSATQELRRLLKAFHPKFDAVQVSSQGDTLTQTLEFCRKYTVPDPASVNEVDCVTYNPGTNATIHWLTILSQQEIASLSRAAVRFDRERNVFEGLTVNVAALAIDVSHLEPDTIVEVVLDGEPVGEFAVEGKPLTFLQNESGWHLVPPLPPSFKQPVRYGGLRTVFGNKPILVYGTRGTLEERSWALAKARYDAETILVRKNGSADVMADLAFRAKDHPDRNVVLYGNASTNSAWPQLMSMSPVQLRGDGVWIERRPEQGEALACAYLRPRQDSDTAVVGVVGGCDIAGMRTTDRLPYFVNGAIFPDLLLFSAKSLVEGNADVRAAGFFGRVWTVDPGEIVWRDAAL